VTHQLQFLRGSEKILVLQDGKQAMLGNFDEITQQGFNVDEILKTYNQGEKEQTKEKTVLQI
jgi:ABC-type transport system involved in cytochrome bd biosynthesis fused ATPase/permease subunit